MSKPTDAELGWVAGIIDGEGCLNIHRRRAEDSNDLRNDSYAFMLKVTMGDLETIERLHSLMNRGTVQDHTGRGTNINRSWSWLCCAHQAESVLNRVKPFLVTKKREAEVALRFLKLAQIGWIGDGKGNPRLSPEVLKTKRKLYWELRMLKSRWRFYIKKLEDRDVAELKALGFWDSNSGGDQDAKDCVHQKELLLFKSRSD